ncbi:hypothetical protein CO153_02430 [Candidatus Pacearchaeota archaeon CG_4_9_14_3_um_filter_30_11]|nr:MAG: hypothetical protein COV77_02465 [Candidatus Pacearchaeota archaeon CG11_big_fil_rev_8_21_14_0_20_30_13]PJA71271.1 MAG: hypothetical protein CO153_02430 [Candidatus Pacearchaeota archaeon CG_4_9_14_3_um_filter_30_11]
MGFIRSGVVFILAIALFLDLFVGNLFLTLNLSLEYDQVSPYIQNLSEDFAMSSGSKALILQNYETKKILCQKGDQVSLDFTFDTEKIAVPCEVINKDGKSVIEFVINESIPIYYYKDYNCTFIECIQTKGESLALISEKAKTYWEKKFYSVALISLIIFVLLFIFVKEKHSAFILSGIIVIFSAIPFRQITWLLSLLPEFLPFKITPIFFTKAADVFMIMIILGIILISLGIGIKFFDLGIKLNELIKSIFKKDLTQELTKEEVKEIAGEKVKEELKKEKKKSKKN